MKKNDDTTTRKKDTENANYVYKISVIVAIGILILSMIAIINSGNGPTHFPGGGEIVGIPCTNVADAKNLVGFNVVTPTSVPPNLPKIAIRATNDPSEPLVWIIYSAKDYSKGEAIDGWGALSEGAIILIETPFLGDSTEYINSHMASLKESGGSPVETIINGALGYTYPSHIDSVERTDVVWISHGIKFQIFSGTVNLSGLIDMARSIPTAS